MPQDVEARYRSPAGAVAYRHKYERSLLRRLSHRRELAVVRAALARLGTRGAILDCPTGAGRLVPMLLEGAERVVAVDTSAAMLAEAQRACERLATGARVEWVEARADALPFADGAFDTAVCHRLLHHMADAEERGAVLRELARVATRGVVCSFSDATTQKARRRQRSGLLPRRLPLEPAKFLAEARAAGLEALGAPRRLAGLFSPLAVVAFRCVAARASSPT